MAITVTCPRCGEPYDVDREAIFAGAWRMACPRCFPPPTATVAALDPSPPDQPSAEALTAPIAAEGLSPMPDLSELRKARETTISVELVPGVAISITYQPDAYTSPVADAFGRDVKTQHIPACRALVQALVVGWDLTDNGEPIACIPENIAGLSPYFLSTIACALTQDLFVNAKGRLAAAQRQGLSHRAAEADALKAKRPIKATHLRPMPPVA